MGMVMSRETRSAIDVFPFPGYPWRKMDRADAIAGPKGGHGLVGENQVRETLGDFCTREPAVQALEPLVHHGLLELVQLDGSRSYIPAAFQKLPGSNPSLIGEVVDVGSLVVATRLRNLDQPALAQIRDGRFDEREQQAYGLGQLVAALGPPERRGA